MAADAIFPLPRGGDPKDWGRLIERHNHRVVVSLLGRGLTIDRARELAQETWLRLIERHRAGRLESLVLPGLAVVQAGFLAANEWRGRVPGAAVDESLAAPGGSAADRAIDRQQLVRGGGGLRACPPAVTR